MANVLENDEISTGECEATVVITPEQFFGNRNFEQGDWAQNQDRPDHIGGTADWAKYPTRHYRPTNDNLARLEGVAKRHGVILGRNDAQIEDLRRFREGELTLADIGDFDASTKPVPVKALPYWWFVRSEKDELGRDRTVKTPRLRNEVELLRLQTGSGALVTEMLESGEPVGIIDRVIVKYRLKVGETVDGPLYVPADLRLDMRRRIQMVEDSLIISDPSFITTVESELNADDGVDLESLKRGMVKVYRTLLERGGLKTHVRFGDYSLVDDPRAHLQKDLQAINPSLVDTEFDELWDRMQEVGRQVFSAYGDNPDSMNQQVAPATRLEMTELQRVNGRF